MDMPRQLQGLAQAGKNISGFRMANLSEAQRQIELQDAVQREAALNFFKQMMAQKQFGLDQSQFGLQQQQFGLQQNKFNQDVNQYNAAEPQRQAELAQTEAQTNRLNHPVFAPQNDSFDETMFNYVRGLTPETYQTLNPQAKMTVDNWIAKQGYNPNSPAGLSQFRDANVLSNIRRAYSSPLTGEPQDTSITNPIDRMIKGGLSGDQQLGSQQQTFTPEDVDREAKRRLGLIK